MSNSYNGIIESKYLPKLFFNKEKKPRHVGVEVEFSNLDLRTSVKLVNSIFPGKIEEENKYYLQLTKTEYGDFNFELDAKLLQKMQTDGIFEKLSDLIGDISNDLDKLVDKTSKKIVPYEIATPPIPISKMYKLDEMVEKLRLNGALGTTNSLQYAFGVHFNVEIPSEEIEDNFRLFKSFLILQKWIEIQSEVDIVRKISPFINDFPKDFIKKVIDLDYQPTKDQFIEDYLEFNPTRNRILDMLPMLAYWDEKKVRDTLPKEKINKRPTFHYRLPNSKVDQLRWGLSHEFQPWIIIELLASNEKIFNQLSKQFLEELDSTIFNKSKWIEQCHKSVLDLLSS